MKSVIMFLEQIMNAPELAYKTVYNKSISLKGRIFTKEKKYKDFMVDYELKNKWLDNLNKIPNIEIRSTCAGHNKERPTFIIFRPLNQNKSYIKQIVNKLNKYPNTFAKYDIGRQNLYRICVATNTYYTPNNKQWEDWWNNIAKYITQSL